MIVPVGALIMHFIRQSLKFVSTMTSVTPHIDSVVTFSDVRQQEHSIAMPTS